MDRKELEGLLYSGNEPLDGEAKHKILTAFEELKAERDRLKEARDFFRTMINQAHDSWHKEKQRAEAAEAELSKLKAHIGDYENYVDRTLDLMAMKERAEAAEARCEALQIRHGEMDKWLDKAEAALERIVQLVKQYQRDDSIMNGSALCRQIELVLRDHLEATECDNKMGQEDVEVVEEWTPPDPQG